MQHTQLVRPMVTKVVVATNVATSWDWSVCLCVASFESFGSGSFGGPVVV